MGIDLPELSDPALAPPRESAATELQCLQVLLMLSVSVYLEAAMCQDAASKALLVSLAQAEDPSVLQQLFEQLQRSSLLTAARLSPIEAPCVPQLGWAS